MRSPAPSRFTAHCKPHRMPAAKRKGVQFCPAITGPSPQTPAQTPQKTPEVQFQAYDPANPEPKQNKPRASSSEPNSLNAHTAPTNMTPSLRTFDASAAPVPRQLSYHFYSSFPPASHEQPPGRESMSDVIRETIPEATIAERAHVRKANKTEMPHIPKVRSGPTAKESEAELDSGLKKGLTLREQRYQNPEKPETPIWPVPETIFDFTPSTFDAVKSAMFERVQALWREPFGDRNAQSDDSLNPNTSIDAADGSKRPTQKPSIRTKIAHVQNGPRANRRNAPRQCKRYIEDNSDDDEEKLQVPARMQKGKPPFNDDVFF